MTVRRVVSVLGVLLAGLMLLAAQPARVAAQSEPVARDGSAVYPGLDVNIGDGEGLRRLHVAFEAQCVDQKSAAMAASPMAREAVLLFLRDKTVATLATPAGKRRLKDELVAVLNKAIGGPRVVRIYFLQFVIL